jgi:hypothetical protein
MSTNECCSRLEFFLNRTQRKTCFAAGSEELPTYVHSIFVVRCCEIRYNVSARIVDRLSIDEFHKKGLIFMGLNMILNTVCTLKPFEILKLYPLHKFNRKFIGKVKLNVRL